MKHRLALAAALLLLATTQLPAQARLEQHQGWRPARVAKWAMLAASVGFATYSLSHSRRAERAYGDLRNLCYDQPTHCALASNRYSSPDAEALFARSVSEDRRAQVGIVGGQVALLTGVALFIYDLRNGHGPVNIPFPIDSTRHDTHGRTLVQFR